MSFKKEYFVKRPIGNGYFVYKRVGEYSKETKNTRSLKETYMGKFIDIEDKVLIYINSKKIKRHSLHNFLLGNDEVYFALLKKCSKYYNWKEKNRNYISNLGTFILKQEVKFYSEAMSQKRTKPILNVEGYFLEFKSENRYILHFKENRIISLEIAQAVNNEKKKIMILEYINPNIRLNIKTERLKDFILILDKREDDTRVKHSGYTLELEEKTKYIYSDLGISINIIISMVEEYKLITSIIKNIENLLAQVRKNHFDQEYLGKVYYLIWMSYYINRYIIDQVDKKTIKEIRNNPFPDIN